MNAQDRKAHRPITVKNNITGAIRALRGTRSQIERTPDEIANKQSGLCAFAESLEIKISKLWTERKVNKWTN